MTVNLSSSGGSATLVTDYGLPSSPMATFAAGSYPTVTATQNVAISIVDDNIVEGNETVGVDRRQQQQCRWVGPITATAVTLDNDATTVSMAATDAAASETPTDNGQFTVTLGGGKAAATGRHRSATRCRGRPTGGRTTRPCGQRADRPGRAVAVRSTSTGIVDDNDRRRATRR